MNLEGPDIERTQKPEGPRERPAAQGEGQTLGRGVQGRAPARQPAPGIGDQNALDHHDPQQIRLGRALPATDTGTPWALPGHSGSEVRTTNRHRV